MLDKIIDGFNNIIDFLSSFFSSIFDFFGKFFEGLINILLVPLQLIVSFLEGVFYFIAKLFEVVVLIVRIFVALFQYIFALIAGIVRSIASWLTFSVKPNLSFPSSSEIGFTTVIDILDGTGILTVVPVVATAFVWFYFVLKMIGLFGGQIQIRPFGR